MSYAVAVTSGWPDALEAFIPSVVPKSCGFRLPLMRERKHHGCSEVLCCRLIMASRQGRSINVSTPSWARFTLNFTYTINVGLFHRM